MTRVWPALWPPWKRTTISACSDSQSTILPLPSSPHWDPTTTTFAIRRASCVSAPDTDAGQYRPGPPSDKGSRRPRQGAERRGDGPGRPSQGVDITLLILKMQRLGLLHLRQRAHLGKHLVGQFAVDLDQRYGVGARRLAADMEGGDIDAGLPER